MIMAVVRMVPSKACSSVRTVSRRYAARSLEKAAVCVFLICRSFPTRGPVGQLGMSVIPVIVHISAETFARRGLAPDRGDPGVPKQSLAAPGAGSLGVCACILDLPAAAKGRA